MTTIDEAQMCSFADCKRPRKARRLCPRHYMQWRRRNPEAELIEPVRGNPALALATRVQAMGDCLIWQGALNHGGYGQIRVDGRTRQAHRYAFEKANGPIPDGMEVDHTCWNRACVRLDHLRLATRANNAANMRDARKDSATGVRNVSRYRRGYRVRVQRNGVCHGGYHSTIESAISEAETLRDSLFGEFSGRKECRDAAA